jgi:hypothetical protein
LVGLRASGSWKRAAFLFERRASRAFGKSTVRIWTILTHTAHICEEIFCTLGCARNRKIVVQHDTELETSFIAGREERR